MKDNLDQAGAFHSIPGTRLDGNDVEGVYDAARLAVMRARTGAGPSFLECRTFRWRGHVGARSDEDVGVRRGDELADWLLRDPLARAEERLAMDLAPHRASVEEEVRLALDSGRIAPEPDPQRLWSFVCAS